MQETELPQEIQILLRDLTQAAKTVLDVRGSLRYGVDMFRMCMRQEALRRTENGHNRCQAARLLHEHRNSFLRGMQQMKKPVQSVTGGINANRRASHG